MDFSSPIAKTITFLFPGDCFDEIFHKFNVLHEQCAPLVASRFLGLAITAGSLMVLMPQIIKIFRARSAAGISLPAMLLNLLACYATCAYSYSQLFAFSQWGDALFMAIQVSIVCLQVFIYSNRTPQAIMFLSLIFMAVGAIYVDAVPQQALYLLQAATIPITIVGKGVQLHANFKGKSTGVLSGISVFMQFAGCLARIFTSIQETGDSLVILTFVIASVMNGLIFAQIFIYWDETIKKMKRA